MEQVAAAAGVGKGTVFHRFGSRMGLMHALMAELGYAVPAQPAKNHPRPRPHEASRERTTKVRNGPVGAGRSCHGLMTRLV
jgi:AcrR family transcriptional regulator